MSRHVQSDPLNQASLRPKGRHVKDVSKNNSRYGLPGQPSF